MSADNTLYLPVTIDGIEGITDSRVLSVPTVEQLFDLIRTFKEIPLKIVSRVTIESAEPMAREDPKKDGRETSYTYGARLVVTTTTITLDRVTEFHIDKNGDVTFTGSFVNAWDGNYGPRSDTESYKITVPYNGKAHYERLYSSR